MSGNGTDFLWFILIGLIAGWLAGVLVKGGGYGVIGDIVVGVLGALFGGWLFRQLGVSTGGGLGWAILVSTVGAVVLIVLVRLIRRAGSAPT
ncbi:MAG TPA: GlsB/YeaQ/YmgE family stress response membrane protein [Planctomycetota bacterium]|nr:GlsB/YeaQ/YmgE family stress response membrane protein [Planctomycetota bacterium]